MLILYGKGSADKNCWYRSRDKMLVPFTQAEHGIYRGDEVLNNQIFRVGFFFLFCW